MSVDEVMMRKVTDFYGRRVMVRDDSDPEQTHIVGVLKPDVGVLSCGLDYLDQGVAKTRYFAPDALHLTEVDATGNYALLIAERNLGTEQRCGLAGVLTRLHLYRHGIRVHNTVYLAQKT